MQEKPEPETVAKSNSTSPTSATSKTSETVQGPVRITATIGKRQWNHLLGRSELATPFHRYEFLQTLAEHTGTTCHPMVGVVDGRPIGLFPVFERSVGPVTALFSPAPNRKTRYLGPLLLDYPGTDRVADERCRHDFISAALSCFDARFSPGYVIVRTAPRYDDHRPFVWDGFDATPQYSYVVDLGPDRSTLLERFSRDARNNIRTDTTGLEIDEEGADSIPPLIDQLRARHRERGEPYSVTADFVTDLYERLPDGIVRPYVVRHEGTMVGGMIALEDRETVYRWQGGVKPDVDFPVNELLDWHIMRRAAERGCRRYDLVGANHRSISRYKSKFDPDLVVFQSLVRSSRPMSLVSTLYKRLR